MILSITSMTFRYGVAGVVIALAALLLQILQAHFGPMPPYITFYPSIILITVVARSGPGILATLLAAIYAEYFLLLPHRSIMISSAGAYISLGVFILMGVLISILAGAFHRLRDHERNLDAQALRSSEDRFRTLVEGVQDYAIYMLDPQGIVVSWSHGAERMKGWQEQEVVGQNFSRFFTPESASAGRPGRVLEIANAQGSFHEEAERVRKDGSMFWAALTITALRDEVGSLRGYAVVARDISERKQAEREIAGGRARLASIVDSAMDAIITIDAGYRIILFNAAAVAMFGYPVDEVLGQPIELLIPQRYHAGHAEHVRKFSVSGVTSRELGDKRTTLHGRRSSGEEFPLEASISQSEGDYGKLFTVILRDVTRRKHAEEQQSLLLGELAHRVKNTLAVVQSIAGQTRRFATPETFYGTFTGRLAALGDAHDLLTRSEWEGAALAEIIRFGLAPYGEPAMEARWKISGPRIWLAPNEAVTLSLVFHELTTNAAKFGALSNGKGKIMVSWEVTPAEAPETLVIRWREHGGPGVCLPQRFGFGSKLLERAVAHELKGETILEFPPSGFECTLRMPLSQKVKIQT